MPELPEVESVRRSVEPLIVGRSVERATLHRRDVLVAPGDPAGGFARQRLAPSSGKSIRPKRITPADLLVGAIVRRVERRGKQLAIIAGPADRSAADSGLIAMGVQLGMSGHLQFLPRGVPAPSAHLHAEWIFENGRLLFHDPRRFGGLRVFRSLDALNEHWQALGPDALTIRPDDLIAALAHTRRAIKAALLDQSVIAGVGNIYADEALHISGIHPARRADLLDPETLVNLADAIRNVLSDSIDAGGSTLRDYADANGRPGSYQAAHAVYGRAGEACRTCGTALVSDLLAQRTTVWCPQCQPKAGSRNRRVMHISDPARSWAAPTR